MGILGKMAFKAAVNIAVQTGAMEKVSNKMGNTLNKITKTKEVEEILADTTFKYKMALEYANRKNYNWLYSIFDEKRNEKYRIKKRTATSKKIKLLDNNNNILGYTKRKKLVISTPLEEDLKECEIVLDDEYLCEVRTYYNFKGEKIETDYKDMELKSNLYHTFFELFVKGALVCQIYKPFAEAQYKEEYILLYNDKKYEKEFLLFALAIESIYYND